MRLAIIHSERMQAKGEREKRRRKKSELGRGKNETKRDERKKEQLLRRFWRGLIFLCVPPSARDLSEEEKFTSVQPDILRAKKYVDRRFLTS